MTIYALPKTEDEVRGRKLQMACRWLLVTLVLVFPVAAYLFLKSTGRSAELYRSLWVGSSVALVSLWNPFGKRKVQEIAAGLRVDSFEVDSIGLKINGTTWSKFVPWSDIARIQEPAYGRGMYVRTHRRFLWYMIPRRTDRYEEMRSELAAVGIPVVQASAPGNWGILFVIIYCASLLCNLLTQDRRILACNFALAIILGIAGAMQSSFVAGDRRFRIRSMLGSFVPAALAAVSLVVPFGFK